MSIEYYSKGSFTKASHGGAPVLKVKSLLLGTGTKNFDLKNGNAQSVQRQVEHILKSGGIRRAVMPRCDFTANLERFRSETGANWMEKTINPADGVIVCEPHVSIVFFPADCPIVTIFDPQEGKLAGLHIGYRSLFNGKEVRNPCILDTTLERGAFNVEGVQVCIHPCIKSCCFGVDHHPKIDSLPHTIATKGPRKGQRSLDLQGYIKERIISFGIPEARIQTEAMCTACADRPEDPAPEVEEGVEPRRYFPRYHSHCYDAPNDGRNLFAAWIEE
ncbi:MAG: laccase domain-containing protein [Patescibacteria group bacterium]